jgi:hypothetical protein
VALSNVMAIHGPDSLRARNQRAAAVEKITVVVRESIADFKEAAPALVQSLSHGAWAKLKRDENRRRRGMK